MVYTRIHLLTDSQSPYGCVTGCVGSIGTSGTKHKNSNSSKDTPLEKVKPIQIENKKELKSETKVSASSCVRIRVGDDDDDDDDNLVDRDYGEDEDDLKMMKYLDELVDLDKSRRGNGGVTPLTDVVVVTTNNNEKKEEKVEIKTTMSEAVVEKKSTTAKTKSTNGGEEKKSKPIPGNPEEQQYLDLVRDIIFHGIQKTDRTGVGTLSKFGCVARYSLRDDVLPMFTTKRVFWRGVVEELIWTIEGKTSAKELHAKGVKIWDKNGSKDFLESIGQGDREEGDLGAIYGHSWRRFGAPYITCNTDYTGQGVDQLAEVIRQLKTTPESRRILINAWNPMELKRVALPPCHVLCQFYVADGELSCSMYQRSCDLGLGVPFNVTFYCLFTRVLAEVCGFRAGEFCHFMGDTHVYLNHVTPLKEQITRIPNAFPKLRFKKRITDIENWSFDDLDLIDYLPQPAIKMDMAA